MQNTCAKCGAERPTWWQYGIGTPARKVYCLDHIPKRYRLLSWWQEHRRG